MAYYSALDRMINMDMRVLASYREPGNLVMSGIVKTVVCHAQSKGTLARGAAVALVQVRGGLTAYSRVCNRMSTRTGASAGCWCVGRLWLLTR